MASNFQDIFGLQNTQNLRGSLGQRSSWALGLARAALYPFTGHGGGPPSLIQLVGLMAPTGHGPSMYGELVLAVGAASQRQFETFIRHLYGNGTGLSGRMMVTLARETTAGPNSMSPAELADLCATFTTGNSPATPVQFETMLRRLVYGLNGITPTRARALLQDLRTANHPITSAQVCEVLEALQPNRGVNHGRNVEGTVRILLTGGMTPFRLRALVRRLTDAAHNGLHGLTGPEIHTLIAQLHDTAQPRVSLDGAQIEALLTQLLEPLGGNGGIQADQIPTLITRLRASLSRSRLHPLATTRVQVHNVGNIPPTPAFLLAISDRSHNHTLCPALIETVRNANSMEDTVKVLRNAEAYGAPRNKVPLLLHLMARVPTVGGKTRRKRMCDFLKGAASSTDSVATVISTLEGFIQAGRAPHGNASGNKFQDAGTRGNVQISIDLQGFKLKVTDPRLNYFCNAHTMKHIDWSEQMIGRAGENGSVEFWPATQGRADVIQDIRTLEANVDLDDLAWTAYNKKDDRIERGYAARLFQNQRLEIGLQYWRNPGGQGLNEHWVYVTHFSPAGQNRIPYKTLKSIKNLYV